MRADIIIHLCISLYISKKNFLGRRIRRVREPNLDTVIKNPIVDTLKHVQFTLR